MLLSSHRPFYSKKRKIMIDKIMRCKYKGDWFYRWSLQGLPLMCLSYIIYEFCSFR
jgi:hypothetical protein